MTKYVQPYLQITIMLGLGNLSFKYNKVIKTYSEGRESIPKALKRSLQSVLSGAPLIIKTHNRKANIRQNVLI